MALRVLLIVNPASGGGRAARLLPAVEAELVRLGVVARTRRSRDLDHVAELAREAIAAGETPVTLSGDGCVAVVAGVLVDHPEAVMGVLPGGRGNDFARTSGIGLDPVAGCAAIARGVARAIDVGEVEGHPFLGIASVGLDSDANRIANDAPAWMGRLVYTYGALRALALWTPARFALTVDGVERSLGGYSVVLANGPSYGGGMRIAPDARQDDGLLDVVLSSQISKLRFLTVLPRVFGGTHVRSSAVEVVRAREVTVTADRPFTVYADGDPVCPLPATIRVRPGAVRVLLPA